MSVNGQALKETDYLKSGEKRTGFVKCQNDNQVLFSIEIDKEFGPGIFSRMKLTSFQPHITGFK